MEPKYVQALNVHNPPRKPVNNMSTVDNSGRAVKLDPRNKVTFWLALMVAAVILLTAGLFSYANVAASSEWVKPQWPWLIWVVPGFIELIIVFAGLDYLITRQAGALWTMVAASAVAVIANGAHTVAAWGLFAFSSGFEPWVGTMISAAAPAAVILITKRVSKIAFVEVE